MFYLKNSLLKSITSVQSKEFYLPEFGRYQDIIIIKYKKLGFTLTQKFHFPCINKGEGEYIHSSAYLDASEWLEKHRDVMRQKPAKVDYLRLIKN